MLFCMKEEEQFGTSIMLTEYSDTHSQTSISIRKIIVLTHRDYKLNV
jgi:hypothetical protein